MESSGKGRWLVVGGGGGDVIDQEILTIVVNLNNSVTSVILAASQRGSIKNHFVVLNIHRSVYILNTYVSSRTKGWS